MFFRDKLDYWFNAPINGWSIHGNKGIYMFKKTKSRYDFGAVNHMKGKVDYLGKHRGRHCFYGMVNDLRPAYGYRLFQIKKEEYE